MTEYLKRRNVAQRQVDTLIDKILTLFDPGFPINVSINLYKMQDNPFNNQKLKDLLAGEIAAAMKAGSQELASGNSFFNYQVTNEKLKAITPLLTLQSIPKDFYSNFYGKDNIFIDLDFDNVGFTEKDIEDECLNIYSKKNGGKANTLIIWADTFEILYAPERIIERLRIQFKETSFEEVLFFNFYNSMPHFFEFKIGTAQIK